jgi:hypothetical protein
MVLTLLPRPTPPQHVFFLSFVFVLSIYYFVVLEFELRASCWLGRCSTTWATLPAFFCDGYFQDRVSWTICTGWPHSAIFLISASQVAMIIGRSHWHLAPTCLNEHLPHPFARPVGLCGYPTFQPNFTPWSKDSPDQAWPLEVFTDAQSVFTSLISKTVKFKRFTIKC